MKKLVIISLLILSTFVIKAQDTLAGWTFPTGTVADANPDHAIAANAAMTITTQGGTSAIDFTKNGFTTYSAMATGWDGGSGVKNWQIELCSTGYNNLKLYCLLTSGGAKPGPRDFKAQYSIGSTGVWTDIPNTIMITANDWTTGVLSNISIPTACDNQASILIRWIMTSDTSNAPPALVLSTGVAKIDNIFVTGTVSGVGITETNPLPAINIFPNPCSNELNISIDNPAETYSYEIISADGRLLQSAKITGNINKINISELQPSLCFLRIIGENEVTVKKIIISR